MTDACFVYGRFLDPDLLTEAAPDARFDRIAHLPSHRLAFSTTGHAVIVADEAHTVWGAVFAAPSDQVDALGAAEHGSPVRLEIQAVDREGARLDVVAFSGADGGHPSEAVVDHMVRGARHWALPTGWVVGLEDLLDPFEF